MAEPQKMIRLKAATRQIYAGKFLMVGDKFPDPVPQNVADGLIRNHYAVLDEERSSPQPQPQIQRKDLTADDAPQPEQSVEAATEPVDSDSTEETKTPRKTPRRYSRRDLLADED